MNKMDLENQKVLVAGLGKSGMAAYELLKNMGAKVSLFDGKKIWMCPVMTHRFFLANDKEELAGLPVRCLVRVFRWILIWQVNCVN